MKNVDIEKSGAGAFVSALVEQSFPQKLITFFGTVLTLWGLAGPSIPLILVGVALLLFTLASHFWSIRYSPYANGPTKWYVGLQFWNLLLSLILGAAAAFLFWCWANLPTVRQALQNAGILP